MQLTEARRLPPTLSLTGGTNATWHLGCPEESYLKWGHPRRPRRRGSGRHHFDSGWESAAAQKSDTKEEAGSPGKDSQEIPASELARPTRFEPVAFGFVEDIHVSSNTCKDVQACADTGSVSDEKSQNVQAHASSSKDSSGSLLDRMTTDGEVGRSGRSLLSVRQVAELLGVCPATVYALCDRRKLPHFRVLNAIRIDPRAVKRFLARTRRRGLPARPKSLH